jgi:hypothetical protein
MSIRFLSMIARTVALAVSLAFSSLCFAAEPDVTAFVHVNVVPMDRDRVLPDQTVLIDKGVIKAVGRDVPVPKGARVIDGSGKFLSPGLADMHSHSESREDMKVYLANGVTTVLNLGGASSDFIDQRMPLINRGERPGPHVYAALRIDGTPEYGQLVVTTPEGARSAVRLAKTNGYRFIKVYNNLSPQAFAAAADEARKLRLGLAGHHLEAVALEREIAGGGFLVAHLEELMYGLFKAPADDPLAAPANEKIGRAVELLKRNRAFVVADLVTFQTIAEQWGRPDVLSAYFNKPEIKYVPFQWRLDWRRDDYLKRSGSLRRRAEFLARLTKALEDAGVPIVAGTDAPTIPGIVPGYSLHDDLDRLTAAGLTRFQSLSAATRTPGEYIATVVRDRPRFGEVQPSYRADLILTDANPLDDLGTLRNPVGVMSHGRWYDRHELQTLLDSVASDYSAAAAPSR